MNQRYGSTRILRPGGIWHLVLTAAIFVYALVVELLSQLPPFEGLLSQSEIVGMPRAVFIVMGLVNLAVAFILLLRPHLLGLIGGWDQLSAMMGPVGVAFVFVYAVLEATATYGLALFVLTGNRLDFYGFAIPALAGLLLLWTQAGRWDRLTSMEQSEMSESE
jgi:hypothetical protein